MSLHASGKDGGLTTLVTHVDGILIVCKYEKRLRLVDSQNEKNVELRVDYSVTKLLGRCVDHHEGNGTKIFASRLLIDSTILRYRMVDAKSVPKKFSNDGRIKLDEDGEPFECIYSKLECIHLYLDSKVRQTFFCFRTTGFHFIPMKWITLGSEKASFKVPREHAEKWDYVPREYWKGLGWVSEPVFYRNACKQEFYHRRLVTVESQCYFLEDEKMDHNVHVYRRGVICCAFYCSTPGYLAHELSGRRWYGYCWFRFYERRPIRRRS